MITAVDSSILLDVLNADAEFGRTSRAALQQCAHEGALVACDVVWAEVASWFEEPSAPSHAFGLLGLAFMPLSVSASELAGRMWRRYRGLGGRRERVVADFLVAAHAQTQADRLLTRDRGFHRRYFAELEILDPTGSTQDR